MSLVVPAGGALFAGSLAVSAVVGVALAGSFGEACASALSVAVAGAAFALFAAGHLPSGAAALSAVPAKAPRRRLRR